MNNPSKLQSEAVKEIEKKYLRNVHKNPYGVWIEGKEISIYGEMSIYEFEELVSDQIQKAYSKGREEVIEEIKEYAINNTIAYKDGNVIKWWPDGLYKEIDLSIQSKEK